MGRVYAKRYYQWCSTDFWAQKTPFRGGCHYTTHGYNKGPGEIVTYNVSVTGSWLFFAIDIVTYNVSVTGSWLFFAIDICLHSYKAPCVR